MWECEIMNIHEQFLFELKGRGFNFKDTSYTEFGFNDEVLNMVYEMFLAGYDKYMLLAKKHGSTIVDYINLGEKDALHLLNDLNPKLKGRFLRACNSLAKVVDEVREFYPDANIYLTNDVPNLLLGHPNAGQGQGLPQFEVVACSSNNLIRRIDGGDWEMALNPYVFDFAEELLANKQAEITKLKQKLEKLESGRLGCAGWYLEGELDLQANITHWKKLPKAPKGYIGDSANVNKEITELAEEESK
ncbi:hypothetical protein WH47_09458 [Habropoda laboriosa]|uniref:Uncharacterized protein n=1 Tax=Habropoda laboriosa TaxID=597456 RepID=A0A0L7QJ18_9HYME|nr:hypothetical protein WH47_09458 [Habropoda laboriosa]